jgi:hypothetical protein
MLKKVEGKIIDTNKIDTQVDDLKKDISKHTLIKTFETYADENVFKQKSTALELFIKNRNEYLPTEVSEVQLLSDHMKKGKFSPINYFIPISKIYGFLKKQLCYLEKSLFQISTV